MKTHHYLSLLAPCAALAAVGLVGCSGNGGSDNATAPADNSTNATTTTTPAAGNTTADSGKHYHLAFVTNNPSDYWTVARKGVEKADAELDDVDVEVKLPGQGTAAEQTQLVKDLLAKGIDGMAISPVDPANQTDMLNDAASKCLLFTQDSDAPNSKRVCYIGTDNVAAGVQAGGILKKALPNGGTVMVFVGKKDAQNAADRLKGVEDAIKGTNIKILDVRTDDTDRAKAKSNVSDALVKYPDLAACVGLWSYNGPAILSAITDAKKVGKVKIVCFDEEDDTLAGVKSGAIEATVVQQPYEFGYQSIINMEKYLKGDKTVVPASGQLFIKTKAITKDTVDAFKTNLNKLRGRTQ